MKIYTSIILILLQWMTSQLSSQCSFQYLSNDTVYQDYIEYIYPKKNADEIIAIGSRFARGNVNDTIYNAPVFQIFDYCGKLLMQKSYYYLGNYRLKHERLPTHRTYLEESFGNKVIQLQEDEFLFVNKAFDTLLKKQNLILFRVNGEGRVLNNNVLEITSQESSQNPIRNVLLLKDGRILVILWNNIDTYFFYYFDNNSNFINKKSFTLGRGIRAFVEADNNEFICSALSHDNSNFQFYKLDTLGEIEWMVTPYLGFGSIRDIQIVNNKIYITGGIGTLGMFLIYDLQGNLLKEFKYDTINCNQRFCSALILPDNTYCLSGYVRYCDLMDERSPDILMLQIDSNGQKLWSSTYNLQSDLGTGNSGDKGYFTDYGGFAIVKANDGGFVTNGLSKYSAKKAGVPLHEDGILIKSNFVATKTKYISKNEKYKFELKENIIMNYLTILGPLNLIKKWTIFNSHGYESTYGSTISESLNLYSIPSGMYFIQFIDFQNNEYHFKFLKI